MRYPAAISQEDDSVLAHFPDCPGCQTQADPGEDICEEAQEALEGWLESHLQHGEAPPRPGKRLPRGGAWIPVSANLSTKLSIRWAREDLGISQAELARRAGVSAPMITKVESINYRPSLDVLERIARALGATLDVVFRPQHDGR